VVLPAAFILTSKYEANYKLILTTIKEILKGDLTDGGLVADLSSQSLLILKVVWLMLFPKLFQLHELIIVYFIPSSHGGENCVFY